MKAFSDHGWRFGRAISAFYITIDDPNATKEVQVEKIIKCVGPIWGQYEAAEKVNKYMIENNMHGQKWHWSGVWNSEDGTSYAEFWRLTVNL